MLEQVNTLGITLLGSAFGVFKCEYLIIMKKN